jgi:hypothetical protein
MASGCSGGRLLRSNTIDFYHPCFLDKEIKPIEHTKPAKFWLATVEKKENLLASQTLRKRGKISPS